MSARLIKRIIYGILTLVWMYVIYSFSAKTGNESADTSGGITRLLLNMFYPQYNDFPHEVSVKIFETCDFVIRKLAHFTEYAILAEFVMLFAVTFTEENTLSWKQGIMLAACCGLFAAGDEFHQMFVGGRSPQVREVVIDTVGAMTGMADCKIRWMFLKAGCGRNC